MYLKLPNNTEVITNYAGSIQLSNFLFIYNVLYIPQFALISIQIIIDSLNCKLIFSSENCVIHNIIRLRMIGLTNLYDKRQIRKNI